MSVKRPSKFLYKPSPLCKEHGLSKHILLLVYIYRYWRDRWTAVEATRQLLSRQTMRKETTENELVEIFLLLLLLLLLLVFILLSKFRDQLDATTRRGSHRMGLHSPTSSRSIATHWLISFWCSLSILHRHRHTATHSNVSRVDLSG